MRAVAREFNTILSTISGIKKRWIESHKVTVKPWKGRPEKLTETEKRYIIRLAHQERDITYNALLGLIPTLISRLTLRQVLHKHFKRKWIAIIRPKLTEKHAKARLQFARYWIQNLEELLRVRYLEVGPFFAY